MNAKEAMLLQRQQEIESALRAGKSGVKLLDDGENNVGNAQIIQPQILPTTAPLTQFTTQKQEGPPRLLNLTATSRTGQSVTIVMTAARNNNTTGAVGPLTGIVEFGNGTQFTRVEFDIPIGPYQGSFLGTIPGTQPEDSGAVIQVPTAVVRAYARYDNAYITPDMTGVAYGAPGSSAFPLTPGAGPFGPNINGHTFGGIPIPPAALQVKAFANYFGRHFSKLYKTQYIYIGDKTIPIIFNANTSTIWAIPPFAKSVQVVRTPNTSAMSITLFDQIAIGSGAATPAEFQEIYAVPANSNPVIPISGNNNAIAVSSATNADTVSAVKLVYEIGF
jgi:hypothetical protein